MDNTYSLRGIETTVRSASLPRNAQYSQKEFFFRPKKKAIKYLRCGFSVRLLCKRITAQLFKTATISQAKLVIPWVHYRISNMLYSNWPSFHLLFLIGKLAVVATLCLCSLFGQDNRYKDMEESGPHLTKKHDVTGNGKFHRSQMFSVIANLYTTNLSAFDYFQFRKSPSRLTLNGQNGAENFFSSSRSIREETTCTAANAPKAEEEEEEEEERAPH